LSRVNPAVSLISSVPIDKKEVWMAKVDFAPGTPD
jgi:hypothetical protein